MSKEPYLALYRKYRPATFSDVVGQNHAVELLTQAISQKKVSHAYLFCGGRGTGKTTLARIVARDIGCNQEDIIEIDAASNRGIDEIRELREAVRSSPFSSPYKVYIIDEAHMLTKEAANALLKTLEEPPSHVIFILATTDPEKLPTTIVSRCQKVVFKQPDIKTLAERLIHVAKEEGFCLPDTASLVIAASGQGSYRDALGKLEQVLTIAKTKEVLDEEVFGIIGNSDQTLRMDLLEAFCAKDSQHIADTIEKLTISGTDALRTYDEFIETIRLGLLLRIGSPADRGDKRLLTLATQYPHTMTSKTILELLGKRHLLEVSDAHAWTAYMAILLLMSE